MPLCSGFDFAPDRTEVLDAWILLGASDADHRPHHMMLKLLLPGYHDPFVTWETVSSTRRATQSHSRAHAWLRGAPSAAAQTAPAMGSRFFRGRTFTANSRHRRVRSRCRHSPGRLLCAFDCMFWRPDRHVSLRLTRDFLARRRIAARADIVSIHASYSRVPGFFGRRKSCNRRGRGL